VNGYNIRVEARTFCREGRKSLPMSLRGKVVDGKGSLIRIAKIAQALEERFKLVRPQRSWIERDETEPRNFFGLLRLRCARPSSCCAAEHRHEVATLQSIELHVQPQPRIEAAYPIDEGQVRVAAPQDFGPADARSGSTAAQTAITEARP